MQKHNVLCAAAARMAAGPDGCTDIIALKKAKIVSVTAQGCDITVVTIDVFSQVGIPLRVLVRHGTYFVAKGDYQDMVTRRDCRFELDPLGHRRVSVPTSCLNAELAIPDGYATFSGMALASPEVLAFLGAAQNEDPMTVQAGIWAITDGYSGERVRSRLIRGGESAISKAHVVRARLILRRLGIATPL